MKSQAPYNPCSDSLPAKVWECLRRNRQFKDHFTLAKDCADEEQRHDEYMGLEHEADENGNKAAAFIFATAPEWDIDQPWPKQPEERRTGFAALFSTEGSYHPCDPNPVFVGGGALPKCVEPFDLDALLPLKGPLPPEAGFNERRVAPDKCIQFISELADIQEHHVLIAVPKHIRDDGHRKKVLDAIGKLFPEDPSRRAVYLDPVGRVLGTEREWHDFLVHEMWRERLPLGLSDLLPGICELARKERRQYQQAASGQFVGLAKSLIDHIDDLTTRRGADVRDRIARIERAIDQVYPKFPLWAE